MVGFRFGNSSKKATKEYQQERRKAERLAFSIDEFSPQDIEKYDLEEVEISGRLNDRTYEVKGRPIVGETDREYDLRELDTR